MKADSLVPSLLLGLGVIGATAVSVLTPESLPWALAGPLLLAGTLVAAAAVRARMGTRAYAAPMILGGAIVAAGALLALADPAFVPAMMPILGACAAMGLLPVRERACT